jgi:hypothetical protein
MRQQSRVNSWVRRWQADRWGSSQLAVANFGESLPQAVLAPPPGRRKKRNQWQHSDRRSKKREIETGSLNSGTFFDNPKP